MPRTSTPHFDETRHRRPLALDTLFVRAQHQLAAARDRELGCCVTCGRPVRSSQDYVREDGVTVHVHCRGSRAPSGRWQR